MSQALVKSAPSAVSSPATAIRTRQDLEFWAHHAMRSGFFKGAEDMSRGVVKIAFGLEYGLTPIQSLSSVHIIEGKPSLPGHVLAALIDNSDRYKYRVEEKDAERCTLRFFKRDPDTREWEDLGVETYTIEEAKGAGLTSKANWKSYPAKMLFWRALMNGFDVYCSGLSVGKAYTHDEMGSEAVVVEDAEYVDAQPVEAPKEIASAPATISPGRAEELRQIARTTYGDLDNEEAMCRYASDGHAGSFDALTGPQADQIEDGMRERQKADADKAKAEAARRLAVVDQPASPPPADSDDGPLPTKEDVAVWTTRQNGDEYEHRRKEVKAHATGGDLFGKAWGESSKGARDGVRHRMIADMTLGKTDSTSGLSVEGLRELVRRANTMGHLYQSPDDTSTTSAEAFDAALRQRIEAGDPNGLVTAVIDGPLEVAALAMICATADVTLDPKTDDEDALFVAVEALPEGHRKRLGEVVLDPEEAAKYNAKALSASV